MRQLLVLRSVGSLRKSFTYVSAAQTTLDGLPWWIVFGPVAGGGSGTKSRGPRAGARCCGSAGRCPCGTGRPSPTGSRGGRRCSGCSENEQSFLAWLVHVSGAIGLVILGLSFYFVAVVVQELLALRRDVIAPEEIVEGVNKRIEERNLKGVVELVQSDDSYFSRALLAGIAELKNGTDAAREKLDRTADVLTAELERRVSYLAVLGTLGPMIGLLGTLKGMIASFSVIAISGVNLEASKVAEGISEALVLTFEGVFLSVPAIFFYAFFRNRISKLSLETTMLADDTLRAVGRVAKP